MKSHNRFAIALAVALMCSPLVASADTLSDLSAQVAALGAAIAQLNAAQSSAPTSTAHACAQISVRLALGSRDASTGGAVTKLQTVLVSQGLLSSDSATGYFGLLTQGALQKWQAQKGIVSSGTPASTGYGAVGVKTRAALAAACSGSSTTTGSKSLDVGFAPGTGDPNDRPQTIPDSFKANPVFGSAPLRVQFLAYDTAAAGSTYTIEFGDGTSADLDAFFQTPTPQQAFVSADHTYAKSGTYTAVLKRSSSCAPSSPGSDCASISAQVATQTITVSGQATSAANVSTSPTTGGVTMGNDDPVCAKATQNLMHGLIDGTAFAKACF